MALTLHIHRDEIEGMLAELDERSEAYARLAKMHDYFAVETAAVALEFSDESLGVDLFRELAATKFVARETERKWKLTARSSTIGDDSVY